MLKGTVFARMLPDQKAQLIESLQDLGYMFLLFFYSKLHIRQLGEFLPDSSFIIVFRYWHYSPMCNGVDNGKNDVCCRDNAQKSLNG